MAAKTSIVSFCDMVNFKDNQQANPQFIISPKKKSFSTRTSLQPASKLESKLLMSALSKVRSSSIRTQTHRDSKPYQSVSDSINSVPFSRSNTPSAQIKNKHKSIVTEQKEESEQNQQKNAQNSFLQNLVLYEHNASLSDIIYFEVVGKEKKVSHKLIHAWKDCLLSQDKQQIFGSNSPYTFSRVFPVNELEKGFNSIYGVGKKRCLCIGEQSLLIHTCLKYLQKCEAQYSRIARKDFDIISDILKEAKLQQLEQLPTCMKQVQILWRILATRWRYSGKLDKNNKVLESALINGRSNFIDLRKNSKICSYLLKHSNQNEKL